MEILTKDKTNCIFLSEQTVSFVHRFNNFVYFSFSGQNLYSTLVQNDSLESERGEIARVTMFEGSREKNQKKRFLSCQITDLVYLDFVREACRKRVMRTI